MLLKWSVRPRVTRVMAFLVTLFFVNKDTSNATIGFAPWRNQPVYERKVF